MIVRKACKIVFILLKDDVLSDCEDSDEDFDPDNYSKKVNLLIFFVKIKRLISAYENKRELK